MAAVRPGGGIGAPRGIGKALFGIGLLVTPKELFEPNIGPGDSYSVSTGLQLQRDQVFPWNDWFLQPMVTVVATPSELGFYSQFEQPRLKRTKPNDFEGYAWEPQVI